MSQPWDYIAKLVCEKSYLVSVASFPRNPTCPAMRHGTKKIKITETEELTSPLSRSVSATVELVNLA